MSLAGVKREGDELVREDETVKRMCMDYSTLDYVTTELILARMELESKKSHIKQLEDRLKDTEEELKEYKHFSVQDDDRYQKLFASFEEYKRAMAERILKVNEIKTVNSLLAHELSYYKSTNPGNKEFDSSFFDDASAAWKANKKRIGDGSYEYKTDKKSDTKGK